MQSTLKYDQVDWTGFNSIPDEGAYEDWRAARLKKHRVGVSQSAMKLIKPHINQLYQVGIDATEAFAIAAYNGWRGVGYSWVINWKSKNMDDLCDNVAPIRSTRELSLEQELGDRSWAYETDSQ